MPKITVGDFRGGTNRHDNQLFAAIGECVASSRNVWASGGAITKVPGYDRIATVRVVGHKSKVAMNDSGGAGGSSRSISRLFPVPFATATGDSRLMVLARHSPTIIGVGELLSYMDFFAATTGGNSANDSLGVGYSTGTIVINTTGAATITATGQGTLWANHITTGDVLFSSGTSSYWDVTQVVSNTILLATGLATTAASTSTAYDIVFRHRDQFPAAMAVMGSSMYLSDGTSTAMVKYDGTGTNRVTASAANEAPVPQWMALHKGYLFGAFFGTASGSSLRWSVVGNAEAWPATNNITIDRGSNGYINGLFSAGNELLIMKERGMYKLVGEIFDPSNPTFSVYPISTPPGLRFRQPFSMADYKSVIVFKADDGWYQYLPGTFGITRISGKINEATSMFDVPKSHVPHPKVVNDFVFASVWKDRIWMSHHNATSTADGEVGRESWILDDRGAWWRLAEGSSTVSGARVPHNAVPYEVSVSGNTSKTLGLLGIAGPRLVHIDSTASNFEATNGTAIDAEWMSKEFSIGYGHFDTLTVYYEKRSGTLTVGWQVDQGAETAEDVDMNVGRGSVVRRVYNINQTGSTIQISFRNKLVGEMFNIYGFEIDYSTSDKNRRL